jgi:hypothetical protein
VTLDIWEFADTDDAFGVFSLDRGADAQKLDAPGAAVALPNGLWLWQGNYAVALRSDKQPLEAGTLAAAAQALGAVLPASAARPPELLSRLPEDGRVPLSEVFVHSMKAMTKAVEDRGGYVAARTVPGDILGAGAVGAMAQYETGARSAAWLFIAKSSPGPGALAERLRDLRREWGQAEENVEGIAVFAEADGFFAAQTVAADLFIAAFRAPSKAPALDLVRRAQSSPLPNPKPELNLTPAVPDGYRG